MRANLNQHNRAYSLSSKHTYRPMRAPVISQLFYKCTCSWRKARENVCERATIGYGLTFDWITKWREFSRPIAQRDNAKPKQIRIIFTLKWKPHYISSRGIPFFFVVVLYKRSTLLPREAN